jgi:hypothetical protein
MNRPTPKVDERQRVSLDFGARVTTPDGFGLYVNRDADSIDHHEGHHWVLLKAWPRQQRKYHWSQITPILYDDVGWEAEVVPDTEPTLVRAHRVAQGHLA